MLTKDVYESLPDAAKAAFVAEGDNYVPVKDAKLKQTLDEVDGKYKSAEQRAKELESKLAGFEQAKAKEIEDARAKALEEARTKGDVKAIEERYQQQMADLEKRTREEARNEALKEFKAERAQANSNALADKIGATYGKSAGAGEAISDLIRHRIKEDPETGQKIFYDAKGSALSVDEKGFIAEISKEARFEYLIKAEIATTGGGNANGNSGGSAPSGSQNTAAQEAKKKGDLTGFIKANLKG